MARKIIGGIATPTDINSNFEELYDKLFMLQGGTTYFNPVDTTGDLPGAPSVGDAYYVRDIYSVKRWSGSEWIVFLDFSEFIVPIDNFVHTGNYSSITTYEVNNIVTDTDSSSYMCILQSLNNVPTNATYWKLLASRSTVFENWIAGTYVKDDVVTDAGIAYICTATSTATQPPSVDWTVISSSANVVGTTAAAINDLVVYANTAGTEIKTSVQLSTLLALAGTQTITGTKNFTSLPTLSTDATTTTQAVRRGLLESYVASAISSFMSNLVDDTTPKVGGALDMDTHVISFKTNTVVYDAGNYNIDWTLGNHQTVNITTNGTIVFIAPPSAATHTSALTLKIVYGAGISSVALPTIKWRDGNAPTLTKSSTSVDFLTFMYDGSAYYGSEALAYS